MPYYSSGSIHLYNVKVNMKKTSGIVPREHLYTEEGCGSNPQTAAFEVFYVLSSERKIREKYYIMEALVLLIYEQYFM